MADDVSGQYADSPDYGIKNSIEQLFREQLENLADMRPSARDQAAVRRADLSALLRLEPQLKSFDAADGATVSADDFNDLRADVRAIFDALHDISAKLAANTNAPRNTNMSALHSVRR